MQPSSLVEVENCEEGRGKGMHGGSELEVMARWWIVEDFFTT